MGIIEGWSAADLESQTGYGVHYCFAPGILGGVMELVHSDVVFAKWVSENDYSLECFALILTEEARQRSSGFGVDSHGRMLGIWSVNGF